VCGEKIYHEPRKNVRFTPLNELNASSAPPAAFPVERDTLYHPFTDRMLAPRPRPHATEPRQPGL